MSDFGKLDGSTVLEFYRTLPGPIERVWEYLTKSELRAKWLCGGDVATEPGGVIHMDFDNMRLSKTRPQNDCDTEPVSFQGEVLIYDPPNVLSFTWPDREGKVPTEVTFRLSEKDGQVLLHLRHERLSTDEHRKGAAGGWHAHLDILTDNLHEVPVRDFWAHYNALKAEYDVRLA